MLPCSVFPSCLYWWTDSLPPAWGLGHIRILLNRVPEACWCLIMDYSMSNDAKCQYCRKGKKNSSPSHSPGQDLRWRSGGWWPAEALRRTNAEAGSIWHQFIFLSSRNQSSPSPVETPVHGRNTLVCVLRHYGQQHGDVVWLSSWTQKRQCPVRMSLVEGRTHRFNIVFS